MKINIKYNVNAGWDHLPCAAHSQVNGDAFCGVGKDWQEAKSNLLKNVCAALAAVVPPPEEVEI